MKAALNPLEKISRCREVLICIFLVLTTLVVYWPVRNFEFINIDDFSYVTENHHTQRGISWENFQWAFQARYAGNWHPLTTLSHMLDCQLFGLNAGAHHLTNLWFHLANTLLLFVLLKRMTGAVWKSAIVAAFFALHPLHVESVAWVSERKDVLSGFFFLLTLWAYVRYVQSPKSKVQSFSADAARRISRSMFYILALIFFSLGLLSKPMLVTLPFVLLLLDFWPLERVSFSVFSTRSFLKLFLEKLPFFALAAASSVVTFFVQRSGGAVVALENYPLIPRFTNALVSYIRYLGKTFYPKSLAVFYPYEGGWAAWQPIAAITLLAIISFAAVWFARRMPWLFVGWFWFLGMLVPVIGLVQVGSQSMADRYTYLPHIGLFMSVVWFFSDWLKGRARLAAAIVTGLLLTVCVVVSSVQVRHWRNTKTLLKHAVAVTTGNAPAHYYLGYVFDSLGATDEALAQYVQAVRIAPDFVDAYCNLGNIYWRQNKLDEASAAYFKALQSNPNFAPAHYGLAELFVKQAKIEEAKNHYAAALRARPDFAEAHYQIAVLLAEGKESEEAIRHFKETIQLKPDWLEPLNNLAWILATNPDARLRDGKLAVELAQRACELSKNKNPGVLDTLAAAYAETQRFADAANAAERALTLTSAANLTQFTTEIQERLKLYQSGQPFRQ